MFVEITCEKCEKSNTVTIELIDSEDVIKCSDCEHIILICDDELKMEIRELV
jgi:DNA-directed RNA polymerase subunit RPC12/RpoP